MLVENLVRGSMWRSDGQVFKGACHDSISTLRLDAAGSYFENMER